MRLPASPIVRVSSGSAARSASRSASASTSPGSTRKPSTPSRTTSGTPPTRVATTGLPASERLDRADRRALVRRGQHERVERGVERRDVVLVAEEEATANDAEVVRELLGPLRSGPSPTRQRTASTPSSRSSLQARRMSSVRLTAVMRPIQPTMKRSGATPISRRVRSRAPSTSPTRSSSSTPSRMTVNFSAGATPSPTRSSRTSGLTATSAVVVDASERSSIRKRLPRTGSK